LKKTIAILLLSAYFLSLGGYELIFKYFIHQSDVQIVKQMYDNKFNTKKLIEIKVPVNMPTIQDWTEYENISGQIQLNGGYYNYTRLKMTRDTMYLVCLPNKIKAELVKANVIVAKNINDVPLSKKGAPSPSAKKVSLGYDNVYQVVKCNYAPFANTVKTVKDTQCSSLTHPYIESPGKPPNAVC
jgi:hypothetical protein